MSTAIPVSQSNHHHIVCKPSQFLRARTFGLALVLALGLMLVLARGLALVILWKLEDDNGSGVKGANAVFISRLSMIS